MSRVQLLSELCKSALCGLHHAQARLVLQMCQEGLLDMNHPSVIQAQLVIGGTEVNPGPRRQSAEDVDLWLVSLYSNM